MKAYEHLVNHAIRTGHTVSVWDGEEWQVKKSTAFTPIIEAIESVELANLRVRDMEGKQVAVAAVSAYGLDDDETVVDWTVCPFMDTWEKAYELEHARSQERRAVFERTSILNDNEGI